MKICIKCGLGKKSWEFSKHSGFSDGLRSTCKRCYNHEQKADPFLFFRKIYATQKATSTKRKHPAPAYTLDDLIAWADAQPRLPAIWKAYQDAGQPLKLAPSIDRINSNLPYTFANMELVTWEENDRRGSADTKLGAKITQHRAVAAYNKDGSLHKTYCSLHEAARDVGGNPTNIQRVADRQVIKKADGRTTVLQSTKGLHWRWA